MVFDPKVFRDNRSGIGMPDDAIATNTTEAWTAVSLLKSIADKIGVGGSFAPSTDVAQGSTTLGQTGGLNQAAVTTAAPTYTTGKTNPLSLDTNGNLRTTDAAGNALLTTIDSKLGDLKGYTDGLEALATLLNGYVDGLETLITGSNTKLDALHTDIATTLAGYVDGIEALITTTNSKDFATQTTLAAVLAKIIAAPATEAKQDSAITQETAINTVLGTTAGAAVVTDANGTVQQYLRGLVKRWVDALGAGTASAALRTTLASDDPLVTLQAASSASITTLASSASSAQLLAANSARKGLFLTNTDANAVLVKYGTTASASSFTVRIPLNGYWEMPKPIYTGRIDAIWEADGAGSLIATEL